MTTATKSPEQSVSSTESKADSEDSSFNLRGTITMAGAHAAHDMYGGFLGPLLPAVQAKLALSLTAASFMFPASLIPGIFQPFLGYMIDKTSRRWFVVLGPGLTAVTISSIGLVNHYFVVLSLLFISGISSGLFHAPAVALMGEYGGNRMGRAMSFFMAGAEISRALAPLIITAAIALLTLEGSAAVMVFGIVASVILYFTVDTRASDTERLSKEAPNLRALLGARRKWLIALIGLMIVNAIAVGPFHFFLVKFLDDEGHSSWYGGLALTVFFAAGVAGMLIGGIISDHIGRRKTLYLSVIVAVPMSYLYLYLEDGSFLPFLALIPTGMALASVRPISMAFAQELLPEARGAMAGGVLALSFVTLSFVAIGFGAIADQIGLKETFYFVAAASLFSLPLIAMLPSPEQIARQRS